MILANDVGRRSLRGEGDIPGNQFRGGHVGQGLGSEGRHVQGLTHMARGFRAVFVKVEGQSTGKKHQRHAGYKGHEASWQTGVVTQQIHCSSLHNSQQFRRTDDARGCAPDSATLGILRYNGSAFPKG